MNYAFALPQAVVPIIPVHLLSQTGIMERGAIRLRVNDTERQRGELADLVWSIPEVTSNLSEYFTLEPGELSIKQA